MAKLYRHYKGNLYEYIGECLHSETLEEMVIYKALYGEGKTWVRPKDMFFEDVTLTDGTVVKRFAPYPGHPSASDFVNFYQDERTQFAGDLDGLYQVMDKQ